MISIREFLEASQRPAAAGALPEACAQMRRLLLDAMAVRCQWTRALATPEFEENAGELARRLAAEGTPAETMALANATLAVLEDQAQQAAENLREQSGQMQAMVGMLTQAVAEISGRSGESVERLQAIERQIEKASSLSDMRELKESLATCLSAVKDAAQQQRKAAGETVEKLQEQLKRAARPAEAAFPAGGQTADYVAVFRLQRAEHILTRFGQSTLDQMLPMIAQGLKPALGPNDRLAPWKGSAYVMFLSSAESVAAIRRRLTITVARIGQRYVEVGNSALLAVRVDWTMFPQALYPSLDAVFAEVDAFTKVKTGNGGSKQ